MPEAPRILISACLLGAPVRYDGRAKTLHDALLAEWRKRGWVVPLCPEIAAHLPTPRPPVELTAGTTASQLLASQDHAAKRGQGAVRAPDGADHTSAYLQAAQIARDTARAMNCRYALLTDGSPTCGSTEIHDGTHRGTRIPGRGLAAQALLDDGVRVFAPHQISALAMLLEQDGVA